MAHLKKTKNGASLFSFCISKRIKVVLLWTKLKKGQFLQLQTVFNKNTAPFLDKPKKSSRNLKIFGSNYSVFFRSKGAVCLFYVGNNNTKQTKQKKKEQKQKDTKMEGCEICSRPVNLKIFVKRGRVCTKVPLCLASFIFLYNILAVF